MPEARLLEYCLPLQYPYALANCLLLCILFYSSVTNVVHENTLPWQAVKHLHDYDLVHMDIKPENVFITDTDECKLGDFGLVIDLAKVSIYVCLYMYVVLYCQTSNISRTLIGY